MKTEQQPKQLHAVAVMVGKLSNNSNTRIRRPQRAPAVAGTTQQRRDLTCRKRNRSEGTLTGGGFRRLMTEIEQTAVEQGSPAAVSSKTAAARVIPSLSLRVSYHRDSKEHGGGDGNFNNNGAYLLLRCSLSLVLAQVRQQPQQVDDGSINGDNGTATEELQRRRTSFLHPSLSVFLSISLRLVLSFSLYFGFSLFLAPAAAAVAGMGAASAIFFFLSPSLRFFLSSRCGCVSLLLLSEM
ncbi:hypothetical protein PIB30_047994 [Stylosanthes scabra]|uniref:Transmembrane protein n=1 Tax=Stylosanthes scabra TaxID=79078 RepID=A0ABU6TIT1_9FABA|nr:hypothetical protein [Stylosanthes scabra]